MEKKDINQAYGQKSQEILLSFATPKTPRQIEKELGIKKIKLKNFVDNKVLTPLNPHARKGRLFILTKEIPIISNKVRKGYTTYNWDLIGWVISSPKQRLIILKTIAIDDMKRTSENIRQRASRWNECLTRISTKEILKELISKGLVETEIGEHRRRYYWISDQGKNLYADINSINKKI